MADDRRAVRAIREEPEAPVPPRQWIARTFTRAEDVVYVGLAVLLAGTALALLAEAVWMFGHALIAWQLPTRVVDLLDRLLLILMIVEILYTVQVSFREHALIPEPFLIVGLIAAIRRVLVLTAEFPALLNENAGAFRSGMMELGLLTGLILVLVASLTLMRRWAPPRADRSDRAERAA
jgi:phosphate-starvation-inducible protein E